MRSYRTEWLITPSVWKPGRFSIKRLTGSLTRDYRLVDWADTIAEAMAYVERAEKMERGY